MTMRFKNQIIFYVIGVYLALIAVNAKKECAERAIQNSDSVCVCNVTYCDDFSSILNQTVGYAAVYESSKSGARFKQSVLMFEKTSKNSTASNKQTITLNASQTYQTILGFGGAFTDSAGFMINKLPKDMAITLINDYFSTNGLEYSMARIPIGGSDYSTRPYSYDDVSGDLNLTHWQLQKEDLEYKIPYIQLAQKVSPHKLKLFGSPWSPPAWMKTNGKFNNSGQIKGEVGGEYYQTWADYFVKFLDAYKTNGIAIWGITVENEPVVGQSPTHDFNSLYLDAPLERDFVKLNLGPTLNDTGYSPDKLRVMIFDDNVWQLKAWTETILADNEAAKYISGIAFHWYGNSLTDEHPASLLDTVHDSHSQYFLLSTEACHLDQVGNGKWELGELYARDIIRDLNHWTTGWIDWNIALDMSGGPRWNSADGFSSPVLINAELNEYYKQPLFYAMGHFSKFISPDSVRIGVELTKTDNKLWITAMKRPDNAIVVVAANLNTFEYELTINDINNGNLVHNLPANSIQTFIWWQ